MKFILKLGLILMVYTLLAGLGLGVINKITRPVIVEQERIARERAQKEVLLEASLFLDQKTDSDLEYKSGYSNIDTTELAGYVLTAFGKGYSSQIKIIVGIDTLFQVQAIEIVFQEETPGLGTKCVEIKGDTPEPWFESQFDGKSSEELLVDKDGGTIQAITGATITSRAITNAVKEKIEELNSQLNQRDANETGK